MTIEWHPLARDDLLSLVAYIATDSPSAALATHEEILTQIERLAEHPSSGRIGRVPGTRELVFARTPYIAAYRVLDGRIVILRILHGSRRWPEGFGEKR